MTAQLAIKLAETSNVNLYITPAGKVGYKGKQESVNKLLPLIKKNKSEIVRLLSKNSKTERAKQKSVISAGGWINENLVELRMAGFTEKDLCNKNWPIGVSELLLWNKKNLSVELRGNTIFFTWQELTGKTVTQTCRPEIRRIKK